MIILYGPTAVGKTELSIALARLIDGEIINADVGQCYKPLSIGTAKPDWQTSDISHHLFDWVDEPRDFTVVEFRAKVRNVALDIIARKKVPIVVGGSGFYCYSLLFEPSSQDESVDTYEHQDKTDSSTTLWEKLKAVDPERAAALHPNDTYRIQRALTLWHKTGKQPSSLKPLYNPIQPYYFVLLTRDRDELYERINQRVGMMMEQGWLQEVTALLNTPWQDFLLKKKLLGYDDIIRFLLQDDSSVSLANVCETIARKTRNYAKRQITWGSMMMKNIRHYSAADDACAEVIKEINLSGTPLVTILQSLKKEYHTRYKEGNV